MVAVSPPISPLPLSRKPVPGRFTQWPQSVPEDYSSVPLLNLEQPHDNQGTASPTSSRKRSDPDDIHEADAADVGRSSTEPHDTSSSSCMNELQDLPASTTPSEVCKGTIQGDRYWWDYIRKFWLGRSPLLCSALHASARSLWSCCTNVISLWMSGG